MERAVRNPFHRNRKTSVPIDEYAHTFHAALNELLDLPEDQDHTEPFMRAQSARWDSLRATTTTLESIEPDERLGDVHKGMIGVFLGGLNVLN